MNCDIFQLLVGNTWAQLSVMQTLSCGHTNAPRTAHTAKKGSATNEHKGAAREPTKLMGFGYDGQFAHW